MFVANTGGDAYIQIQAADSTGTSGLKFGRNSVANRAGIDWSASTDALQFRTAAQLSGCESPAMEMLALERRRLVNCCISLVLQIQPLRCKTLINNTDARIKTNNNGDLVFEADYNNEQGDSRIGFEVDGSSDANRYSGRLGIGTTSLLKSYTL